MNTKSSGVINTAEVEEKARIKKGRNIGRFKYFFLLSDVRLLASVLMEILTLFSDTILLIC